MGGLTRHPRFQARRNRRGGVCELGADWSRGENGSRGRGDPPSSRVTWLWSCCFHSVPSPRSLHRRSPRCNTCLVRRRQEPQRPSFWSSRRLPRPKPGTPRPDSGPSRGDGAAESGGSLRFRHHHSPNLGVVRAEVVVRSGFQERMGIAGSRGQGGVDRESLRPVRGLPRRQTG